MSTPTHSTPALQSFHGTLAVVGAGQIGQPLVRQLAALGYPVIWLSRTRPQSIPAGVTHRAVDVCNRATFCEAIAGASAIIAAINPPHYDATVWADTLPRLHTSLIAGAIGTGARLVLLDSLYLYATNSAAPLAPDSPQTPSTKKGQIRKHTADMVVQAQQTRNLRATVLRASDFWGPELHSALFSTAALQRIRQGRGPFLFGNPDAVHAFSFRDDVVHALLNLASATDSVEGQVFHAPVIHVAPRALARAFADALGVNAQPIVAPTWLMALLGLGSRQMRGMVEMIPQWQRPYLVDDSDYCQRFQAQATPLATGVQQTIAS